MPGRTTRRLGDSAMTKLDDGCELPEQVDLSQLPIVPKGRYAPSDPMSRTSPPAALDQVSLLQGVSYLAGIDPDLAQIVSNLGSPPLWDRPPGFSTLILIILEQQVSLASARAAFTRLVKAAGQLVPERFLEFTDQELGAFGFSRQKARYGRELSNAIVSGQLDLQALAGLDDAAARDRLLQIKGIGPWTADIYLLMALLRPDIWPSGDLALAKAVQKAKELPSRPGPEALSDIAAQWKPWRAVAARILWHNYLVNQRGECNGLVRDTLLP